jgi:DNA-binding response OmpR family regulator
MSQPLPLAKKHLGLSRNRTEKFDIVITDFDMGRMNGTELYRHIREERAETAVLFVSSNADRILEILPECPVQKKPFQPQQFVARVAELLSTAKSCALLGASCTKP